MCFWLIELTQLCFCLIEYFGKCVWNRPKNNNYYYCSDSYQEDKFSRSDVTLFKNVESYQEYDLHVCPHEVMKTKGIRKSYSVGVVQIGRRVISHI